MERSGWIAAFCDGPLADCDQDRVFPAGEPWDEIVLAAIGGASDGWAIVGGSGLPASQGDEPWPGEVRYRRLQVIEMAGVHGEPVACYELIDDNGPARFAVRARRDDERNRYWGD